MRLLINEKLLLAALMPIYIYIRLQIILCSLIDYLKNNINRLLTNIQNKKEDSNIVVEHKQEIPEYSKNIFLLI